MLRRAVLTCLLSVLAAGGLVTGAQAVSASTAGFDLTGVWTVVNTSGPGASGTLDITNGKGGAFDGTGYGGSWVVKGSVSGNHVHYTVSDSSYTSTVDGTINSTGTRITYSWTDTNKASGTAYLVKAGKGIQPPTTGAPGPTTPTLQSPQFCDAAASAVATVASALGRIGRGLDSPGGSRAQAVSASVRTVTVGRRAGKSGRVLTLRQAERRAMALLRLPRKPLLDGVAIYGLAKPLRAGSVVTEGQLGLPRPILPALRVQTSAWLYWEDLAPLARSTHRSVVLVFAARGGKLLAHANFLTYPKVNGRPAAFVTSSKHHVVYYQSPAPPHPVRLSAQQFSQITHAMTSGSAIAKKTLAHASEVNKNALITLAGEPKQRDDTFASEEHGITNVFAQHGVATAQASNTYSLNVKVGEAADSGATTITVFLDGHGLGANHSKQPVVVLGDGHNPGEGRYITASDLTQIAAAHPDITFNFIIDACFSGRFVDPLKSQPNVASVATSSGANEFSKGPEVLYTQPEVISKRKDGPPDPSYPGGHVHLPYVDDPNLPPTPDTVRFPAPAAVTPSGKNLFLDIPENLPVDPYKTSNIMSPFTTGMVAALNQAFIGTGADPNITSVIQDARTLEPSYDIAAITGQTQPSPDPTPSPFCIAPNTPDPEPTGGWFTGE